MNDESTGSLLPNHLSDEAAFVLSEFLNFLALACDEKYYAQIRRYAQSLSVPEPPVWGRVNDGLGDEDIPF
jgi:hypothetical protein